MMTKAAESIAIATESLAIVLFAVLTILVIYAG